MQCRLHSRPGARIGRELAEMKVEIFPGPSQANPAAADCLIQWLTAPGTKTLMVAAGNTPLELYRLRSCR